MGCRRPPGARLKVVLSKCFWLAVLNHGNRVHTLPASVAAILALSLLSLSAWADNPALKNTPSSEPQSHFAYTNRLIASRDPYLLLHAHNPVDWYPWGAEAFAKARREKKPIFLSIGYSTCYWCHVAERIIYSNPEIAKLMNQ